PAFATNNSDAIHEFLQYHVLPNVYPSDFFNGTFKFLPTFLRDQRYENVTGGQVIAGVQQAGKVWVAVSGLGSRATLSNLDLRFQNGVLHIIDTFFIPPLPFTASARQFNLSSSLGAVLSAGLASTVDETPDLTIFAPNNVALQNLGSTLSSYSVEDLSRLLRYHMVSGIKMVGAATSGTRANSSGTNSTAASAEGSVHYSSNLPSAYLYPNGTTLTSLEGSSLHLTFSPNSIFVNSARIIQQDLLLSNGVLHVIDNVLNYNLTSATPIPTQATQIPVVTGSSIEGNVLPFTTALPNSTSILFSAVPTTGTIANGGSTATGTIANGESTATGTIANGGSTATATENTTSSSTAAAYTSVIAKDGENGAVRVKGLGFAKLLVAGGFTLGLFGVL
ncbi:MAG: hypothetical protein Q9187_004143, partial [Circinaria calcarea]